MTEAPAPERDFNSALDDILLAEEKQEQESYEQGVQAGRQEGNPEGYHLGYHRGAELGAELGYYLGVITYHLSLQNSSTIQYSDKIRAQLCKVRESIAQFPRTNSEEHDLLGQAETIRAQYKKACALLKVESRCTLYNFTMESRLTLLQRQTDRITRYLTPLLPLANCHTVEFLTDTLWERLLPTGVRTEVGQHELDEALDVFWGAAEGRGDDTKAPGLVKFVRAARAHGLRTDGATCLSADQARERLERWGGRVELEEEMTQFVSPKKGHEVREMSWLVSSLSRVARSTHCVELGGGKGYLGDALARCSALRTLTVDCDEVTLRGGQRRTDKMKKLLPTLMRQPVKNRQPATEQRDTVGSHRFATAFVDERTDLVGLVKEKFPEDAAAGDLRLLLTGLHTCGNLGPDSLRLFTVDTSVAAMCNVPCCYHLLTEPLDRDEYSLEKNATTWSSGEGFPMSQYLRGYRLGQNARMLAAQSIDRTVADRAVPSVGLHYRAILQVLLKEHLPGADIPEGRLRGVAAKCQNFEQYFNMATDKLKLGSVIDIPDLSDVEERYNSEWKRLVVFYLLRLCLAQVVEGLILLDRILFLLESGLREDGVFLVRLFEASKSPRCHGIVALR